ncbi:hypothetical protein SAMN04489707_10637 [Paenacidovorax caeni]|uniref:Uncharacterized protein n=1 Tax=Paenacidovorax caeni TaxID=343013 RepID=A0A1I7KPI8_9BURK|nr:hypothetical protein [Paenacidovorax caeni]SFU99348.1 hypothetical protein SAMN04489707_10637 [Paenacidovorax caeni]
MSTITSFINLAAMRRRAGGGLAQSMAWAFGLLWRSHQSARRRRNQKTNAPHA